MNGKADVIQMEQALHHLQLTKDQFLSMCVVAGCDYLKNIKGIGIYKAKQLVKKDNLISELQKQKKMPHKITGKHFSRQGMSLNTNWSSIL